MKKVTVGLCVKNNGRTIGEAVMGILNQDFPHDLMEIVVVDGMSTDATLSIITSCTARSDIQTRIFSDLGGGLGIARQIVVDRAVGQYIAWIDGDIVIPKKYLATQVSFLDGAQEVGAVQWNRVSYKGNSVAGALEVVSMNQVYNKKERRFLATRGAVYRVKAIKEVGGFDKNIKGACEDIDLSFRMWRMGWKLCINEGIWLHVPRESWKGLWDEYWWYGYGAHFIGDKHKGLIILWQWLPPMSLALGLRNSVPVYKLTQNKLAFLMPFNYLYKNLAWLFGFVKSHLDRYSYLD